MIRQRKTFLVLYFALVLFVSNLFLFAGCGGGGGGGGSIEYASGAGRSGDTSESSFQDTFSTDSLYAYTIVDTSTIAGKGTVTYENESLRINTGDDIGVSISHSLPALSTGNLKIDFRPLVNYPDGGRVYIRLWASSDSYYEVYNTDGYGAKGISKYVGGQKVDSAAFSNEYVQENRYKITIAYGPEETTVEAFGDVAVMNTDDTVLTVNMLGVGTQPTRRIHR